MQQKPNMRRSIAERIIFEAAVYSLRRVISSRVDVQSWHPPALRAGASSPAGLVNARSLKKLGLVLVVRLEPTERSVAATTGPYRGITRANSSPYRDGGR